MARNTSSMSILSVLLVLFLSIGGHTDARKFSTQILHWDVPPPQHSGDRSEPEPPPALTNCQTYTRQISQPTSGCDVPPPQSDNPGDPPSLISDQTYAKESSLPTLRYDVPLPEFNTPPASTDNALKNDLQEELATMSYHLEWVCDSNNPSHPKCRGNKFSWPELVGKQGKEAKSVIQKENPYIDAVDYAPQDAIVTDNYCCNRVRLIMNCDAGCDYENATVFQVPIVG